MTKSKIQWQSRCPGLEIDGRVVPPVLYGLSDIPGSNSNTAQAQRNIARFHEAGIDLVNVDTGLHLGWHKATPFEPDAILSEIGSVLEANPEARVLVRLHMNPPYWWLRDHPEECVIYRTKTGDVHGIDNGESDRLIANDFARHIRVSLASKAWLNDASEKLKLLCEALGDSPEGKALLGIQVACGGYGEWHQWGTDVSRPMKEHFREFLKQKYTTDEALQKAWHDPAVTFETAGFQPEIWSKADDGCFRDPRFSQHVMDAQRAIQSTVPHAILRFCRVIKEHLPEVLVGAFYGYYLGCGPTAAILGHLQVETLYREKQSIDFLCGPFCYLENRKPEGVPMQRGLLESNRLRDMLWLTEMDQHPESVDYLGGDIQYKDSTVATLRRNVLQPLLAGQGLWYYDHRVIPKFVAERPELARAASIYRKRGWWEEGYLMDEIQALQGIARELAGKPYEAAADVLIVYAPEAYYCRTCPVGDEYALHEAVARAGVAYDCIYLSELPLAELSRYRCVIMADCHFLTPEQRQRARALLKDTHTLWLYAAGFCDSESLAVENISETVGITVKKSEDATRQAPPPEGRPRLGTDGPLPRLAAEDPEAEALAYYENGQVAAAKKGKDIWFGLPSVDCESMKEILRSCGAHGYVESGDPVMAGHGLVAIHCVKGGELTLTLKNGKRLTISTAPHTTAVFDSQTGERRL